MKWVTGASEQWTDPVRPPTLGVEEVTWALILKKQLDIKQLFADLYKPDSDPEFEALLTGSKPEDNPSEPEPYIDIFLYWQTQKLQSLIYYDQSINQLKDTGT